MFIPNVVRVLERYGVEVGAAMSGHPGPLREEIFQDQDGGSTRTIDGDGAGGAGMALALAMPMMASAVAMKDFMMSF